ncbi:MotA/TolQ/ExbB proton channel family protein [Pigmentibacter sp. JX0631]|uniref:MotA/TolQ/ExbB proton channel family protein n=1 Tax=Pigmentibacter sp. JX0631 TaxID=2976982 RepID=UPI0024695052|nr:MotA/TolQ/ExbB proton channel family protein [Pigmentibacter sp. JX0631]WGL61398.1 MotA/TolQ/ExbB proton channel family protein [Pigmentibacter sp. JX0631]
MDNALTSTKIDWLSIVMNGGPVGLAVMLLLAIMSIWAWAVIIGKMKSLSSMHSLSERFLTSFWEAKSLSELNLKVKDMDYSPAREVFRSGFNEMIRVLQTREKRNASGPISFDTVKRTLTRQKMLEEANLSTNLSILAVCSSAGPFIGLFGTVVGIIRAFHDIGASGASSLASVAPGISEALIATALGLFVAIPAVVFYNILLNRIRKHLVLLDGFSSDFINILERHYTIKSDNESA